MKITADVVIMGSGLAGITAADSALKQGKKVMVFEKRPFQGGSVSNCPIVCYILKHDQAYQDAAFKLLYEYSNYSANPAVIRTYVDNGWKIKDYIEGLGGKLHLGVDLSLDQIGVKLPNSGFPPAIQAHADTYFLMGRGKGHGAALLCLNAMKDIIKRGGEYFLDTPITDIHTENGKVVGVTAVNNATGEVIEVDCKAVIIASGGIMDNKEMIKEHTGFTYTDNDCSDGGNVLFNCFPNSKQTGDGHQLAWKLGGAKGSIAVVGHNLVPGPGIVADSPWITYNQIRIVQEQPYLWVNVNGERFIDESLSHNHMAISTGIYNQPNRESFIVFDEDTKKHMEEVGVDYVYMIFPAKQLTDVTGQFKHLIEEVGNKHVFMADSISQLAAQAGIDEDGLEATLERYNGYCDEGVDKEFTKDANFLRPVRKGPYYALRVFCGGYDTIGGIKVNGRMEVISDDGIAIPGLYAAGDIVLNEFYGNPPVGGCGSLNTSMAFGFAAGDYAAQYAEKE